MNSYFKYLCILFAVTLFSACSGGDGDGSSSSSSSETLAGVFIDSPVKGLRWVSGDLAGTTDAAGTFQYKNGAMVKFYVGDILIGEATGNAVIIPVDLVAGAQDITNATVTNIVRFLLTLDNDNDPSNGIEITEAIANLGLGETVNFAQSTADFTASGDVAILVSTLTAASNAGPRTLTSVVVALVHVENSIKDLLAGAYSGTYSGDASGTWEVTIDTSGGLSGTATSSEGTLGLEGNVSTNGNGTTDFSTSGEASDGTAFSGTFYPDGTASGIWNDSGEDSGTWSGSKN